MRCCRPPDVQRDGPDDAVKIEIVAHASGQALVDAQKAVFVEKPKNDTPENAVVVKLPAALCGAIETAEDVDYFRFAARLLRSAFRAGQHMTVRREDVRRSYSICSTPAELRRSGVLRVGIKQIAARHAQ